MDRQDLNEIKWHLQEMRASASRKKYEARELNIAADAITAEADKLEKRFRDELEKIEQSKYTYCSTQQTKCAQCGEQKHTPFRFDAVGGHVCMTCVGSLLDNMFENEDANRHIDNYLNSDSD